MKAFKINNIEKVKQEVNLPAGTYTYSFRVLPVGTSYTFKLDNLSFTFEGLTAGVLNKRMKYTFELAEAVSFFYLSNTIGDCVYEPQIEEGVFATTPGSHPLDFERLISETGIDIDSEFLSLYAKKTDVSAEIQITADRIDSTVGNISNDIEGIKRDVTTISQTTTSIQSTVTNHTTQISRFQQTVDLIYTSIEDVGSGEFASIIQRLDGIELKVGATGQDGSIQLALDSIALTVYDENTGLSAINQKADAISLTVTNHTSQIATFQQTVDQIYLAIEDVGSGEFASIITRLDGIELKVGATGKEGSIQVALNSISSTVYDANTGMSAINQKVGSITATVTNHTSQISTFQQTVDQIYLAIEDVGSGEFASIIQRLDKIELKVGAPGKEGSIQVAVDSVTTRVEDIDFGLTEVVVKVGSIDLTVADNKDKVAALRVDVNSISSTVYDANTGMSAINQKVNSITSTVYDEHDALLSQISQDGVNVKITASRIELEGLVTASKDFKILTDGSMEAKNGKFTGEINATSGSFTGTVIAKQGNDGMETRLDAYGIRVFNDTGKMNIRFGMKNGYAVMEYYDNDGELLYDLGPNGIGKVEVREEKWWNIALVKLSTNPFDYAEALGKPELYKNGADVTPVITYYRYTSKIVAGVNQDPSNDGKIFIAKNKTGERISGIFCARSNGIIMGIAGQTNPPYPTDIHPNNPAIKWHPNYLYWAQPLLSYTAGGVTTGKNYSAYWTVLRSGYPAI